MKKFTSGALAAVLCLWLLPCPVQAADVLVPVGQVVGLELSDNSVSVAAFDDALGHCARDAGLEIGDEILEIDGAPIDSAQDVRQALERSDGQITLRILRDDKPRQLCLTPQATQTGPRLGVYLRQGITGIGTVTWYDPDDGSFATLGHGVNDPHGDLVKMTTGKVYDAQVLSVKRGECGKPGQLRGSVAGTLPVGTIGKNTHQGVFGKVETGWEGKAIPVAAPKDVKKGPAVIRSTVSGSRVQEYSVEILKIYANDHSNGKNMLIRVTDPALLATTGGIVQGMSGSPIIQDGKLVGAVTHVLVNDPTTGYGIFIENMLDAAG